MSKKGTIPSLDFYQNNSNLKWVVLVASILISIGSIYYTNILVDQLKERERQQVQLYAKAIEYTANGDDTFGDVNFIAQEILFQNNSIPIIQVGDSGRVLSFRNVDVVESWSEERRNTFLRGEMKLMSQTYEPITVTLRDPQTGEVFGTQFIYYKNSFLLRQLIAYPYIQLSVIAIFGFIAYLAFNYSKAAEQNRVWVGLAKETAHQLGTPLSSLMAWVEVIRDDPDMKQKGMVEELEKDIQKLRIVTERFSSIGSIPALKKENVVGNEAPGGGIAGDLLILIEETEDKFLKRDGNNLVFDLYISFIDAAIGTSIEVPSVGGKVKIKIEPGTQSGKILRLRGKGLKDVNGYEVGDQLIYVNVWTPKKLTAEEKAKLETLRSSPNFEPHPDANEKGFFERMKEFFN